MRRSQRSKPLDTFLITRAVPHIVISSTKLEFFLTDEALIQTIEITRLPRPCHQIILLPGILEYTVLDSGSLGPAFSRSARACMCSNFGGTRSGLHPPRTTQLRI